MVQQKLTRRKCTTKNRSQLDRHGLTFIYLISFFFFFKKKDYFAIADIMYHEKASNALIPCSIFSLPPHSLCKLSLTDQPNPYEPAGITPIIGNTKPTSNTKQMLQSSATTYNSRENLRKREHTGTMRTKESFISVNEIRSSTQESRCQHPTFLVFYTLRPSRTNKIQPSQMKD